MEASASDTTNSSNRCNEHEAIEPRMVLTINLLQVLDQSTGVLAKRPAVRHLQSSVQSSHCPGGKLIGAPTALVQRSKTSTTAR